MNYHLSFNSPWYLLLLAGLPALWWLSFRSLAGLGPVRRPIAIAIRSLVLGLLVLAAAETQLVRSNDRLTVIYLLDQSLSIPEPQRRAMVQYVNAEVRKHRQREDRVGVIVFGRDAAIEFPPFDDDVQLQKVESTLDPDYTNLAAAMKLAQAAFPEDAAKRIVLLSDGNQNAGNALEQAQGLATSGIGIDVLPVRYEHRADTAVERVVLPGEVRRGQPFDLRVVVNNTHDARGPARPGSPPGEVRGRLILSRLTDDQPQVLSDQPVTLPPGKKVFSVRQQIDSPNFYTYEARFVPDDAKDDSMPQNNRATAFTQVQGKGQVLLIEDSDSPHEHDWLAERLRQQGIEVTVRGTNRLFSGLAELQPYDAVVLANVPRSSSQDTAFSDQQIEALVRNTQQLGAGLIMLGGPNSFGAGGWAGTELEKAMPVDFQIQNAKVAPRGALVMLMHASEIGQGNFWQKKIAGEAVAALSTQDYCGVIHWNGVERWLWGGLIQVAGKRENMLARIDRMTPGDMPDFEPAMVLAHRGFVSLPDAAVKHMIIISDGDPSAPSPQVINNLKATQVTISTVAVGAHGPAESQLLSNIASSTGGKYYTVNNARALPRIFQNEVRRVARPLVYEDQKGMNLRSKALHEMTGGLGPLPPITGYVLTQKKDSSLVEVALVAPKPAGEVNSTILAGWPYGAGKAVAFTTDAGARWTKAWPDQPAYDKLFGQMLRWAMRPAGNPGKFITALEAVDGQIRVVVTALDKNDEFLNFLSMTGTAVGPDLKPVPMKLDQTAPGRYVGTLPARDAGTYLVMLSPGAGMAPIRAGVSVPYSDEFRDRVPNDALLGQLAAVTPKGGPPGQVIEGFRGAESIDALLAVNTFRHDLPKATSGQDVWHYLLLLGSCLFFGDVFFRRVQVTLGWVPPLAGRARDWLLRRQPKPAAPEYIERLRSRKEEVAGRLEQLRAATRFELPPEKPADTRGLEEPSGLAPPMIKPAAPSITPAAEEEESYTERLLRAKKQAWEEGGRRRAEGGGEEEG